MSKQRRIKRLFNLAFGTLAMLAVALLSAFVTMRLAIHGREVEVPALDGLSVKDAVKRAKSKGLNVLVENRFYSTAVPAGRILSQLPAPGEIVRRDWQVRVAESLGSQRVAIPDLVGQSERTATIALRRLTLDLGVVAHLAVPGSPDVILAQTPPPNAENIDSPRVSLLVSQAQDTPADAIVMPVLTGVPLSVATFRAISAGLHIISDPDPASQPPTPPDALAGVNAAPASPDATSATSFYVTPAALPSGNVVGQSPVAGHRVARGEGVHLVFARPTPADVAPDGAGASQLPPPVQP